MTLSARMRAARIAAASSLAGLLAAQSPANPPAPGAPPQGEAAQAPEPHPAMPSWSGPLRPGEPHPWRLNHELGGPSWFKVSGEQRVRYETMDGSFRYGRNGANQVVRPFGADDDIVFLRTLLLMEAKWEHFGGGVELIDSRQWGADTTSYLDNTMVDSFDILQAYADFGLGAFGGGKHRLRVGRETMDLGAGRLVGRANFRNTINAFTGVDWLWQDDAKNTVRAFWTTPVRRLPASNPGLRGNDFDLDDQDQDVQFWGIFGDRRFNERDSAELYLFGLIESGENTRHRDLLTPGFRVLRARKRGEVNFELEVDGQFGRSRATNTGATLTHKAAFFHAGLGHTLDMAWAPSLQLAWDYATGDRDPNDDDFERFDTLFGRRRVDLGANGIWGPVSRVNINSPEIRLILQPARTVEFTVSYRGVWLASDRDVWAAGNLRDSSGQSGTHVGELLDARLRWEPLPRNVLLEAGASYLTNGSFQEKASNGLGRDGTYAYVAMSWFF